MLSALRLRRTLLMDGRPNPRLEQGLARPGSLASFPQQVSDATHLACSILMSYLI